MPIQRDACPVVAHGGARVGVRGGFLHVAQGDAGIEGGGDEGVAQRVRADRLVHSGASGDAAHDPARAVAVHSLTVRAQEDRSVEPFTDREVDRAGGTRGERDGDDLAALAQHGQGAVATFEAEFVDVRAECLGDA